VYAQTTLASDYGGTNLAGMTFVKEGTLCQHSIASEQETYFKRKVGDPPDYEDVDMPDLAGTVT
jgi:hypothetical protein